MRAGAAAAALLLLLANPVAAQTAPATAPAALPALPGTTPETQAAAQELLHAMRTDQQLVAILTALRGQMVASLGRSAKPGVDVGKVVDELLLPEMRAHVGELAAAIGVVWAGKLSVDDLHAMRDFYASPAGQHLLAAQADIAAQSFAAGKVWGERVAREAVAKHAQELRNRGVGL